MKKISLCIPLKNPTKKNLKEACKKADLIEIWIDQLTQEQLLAIINEATKPILIVCKDSKEKGKFRGSAHDKVTRLIGALAAKANFIDCSSDTPQKELSRLGTACKKYKKKLILSSHFWHITPPLSYLEKHASILQKKGAHIIKIATYIRNPEDTVTLFELASRLKSNRLPFVLVGMGEKSTIARLGCALLGGQWTYVALSNKMRTSLGQPLITHPIF